VSRTERAVNGILVVAEGFCDGIERGGLFDRVSGLEVPRQVLARVSAVRRSCH
jgi:hypothetical protein